MTLLTTCRFISTVLLILCASCLSSTLHAAPTNAPLTPWWQSPWFFGLSSLIFIVIIWLGIRISTKQLRKQNQQLAQQVTLHTQSIEQLLNQKEHIITNISQEFRTPLTLALAPMSQLIDIQNNTRIDPITDNTSTTNKNNLNNHKDQPNLISQLQRLFKTRNKTSQANAQNQDYSLQHTLNYIVSCFDSTFTSKNLTVNISSFDDLKLSLKPNSLEIILASLIANAIKYTNKGGNISITIEHNQKTVTITVSDNGIGIEPEHQQLVFNHQAQTEQQPKSPVGTGIGLALVKELVASNQGSIALTSALNKGSSFIVTLPLMIDATDPKTTKIEKAKPSNIARLLTALEIRTLNSTQIATNISQSSSSHSENGKSLVLVIDDNQELLNLIKEILTPHFDCQLAPNGEQGLHMAQEHLPDLVLCDVMMPGISGFEVLSELKTSPLTAHIPVILLTAKGDAESRIEGWKNRADEYLSKPFNNQELVARISNLLAIRKTISNRYQQQFAQATPTNSSDTIKPGDNNQSNENSVNDQLDLVAQNFSQQLEIVLAKQYQDEDLTVATIATELALSQRQLIRKTKSLLGMTPNETLRAFRLKKAAEFLREGKTPSTITFDVGFSSHSYFGTCFKNQFGCTPSEYRKQHLNSATKGACE